MRISLYGLLIRHVMLWKRHGAPLLAVQWSELALQFLLQFPIPIGFSNRGCCGIAGFLHLRRKGVISSLCFLRMSMEMVKLVPLRCYIYRVNMYIYQLMLTHGGTSRGSERLPQPPLVLFHTKSTSHPHPLAPCSFPLPFLSYISLSLCPP
jgi:hypothetical protein